MKTSPQMQRVISQLAEKHGVNLYVKGARLQLKLPGYNRLLIESLEDTLIQVAHSHETYKGDSVIDMGIRFFTGGGDWIPMEINLFNTDYSGVAKLNSDHTSLIEVVLEEQEDLARFAELWAEKLLTQNWLKDALPQAAS